MKSKTVWESGNYKLKIKLIDEKGDGPFLENLLQALGIGAAAWAGYC